jgi:hypothetical protein
LRCPKNFILEIKVMFNNKSELMLTVILILVSIVLPGCSKTPEPEVAKTVNINQSPIVSNSNIAVNSVNSSTPTVNSASTPIISNKSMPKIKEPTPNIGSGGGDMFLFTQARGALSSDEELINAVIVEIKEGSATLTGSVSSEAQKKKAGQLIQSVQGIKSVKNNLRVSS